MNRRLFIQNSVAGILAIELGTSLSSCAAEEFYAPDDFEKAPKTDAHFHYNVFDDAVLRYAASINMHILTINVDAGEPIDKQFAIAQSLKNKYPGMIDFLGTFAVTDFGNEHFADETIAQTKKCMDADAKGIKIWKNIGMVLKDRDDSYVMADNPGFAPVFAYLEKAGIPLVAHLGEPRNCWLPYEEITMGNDLNYYRNNPQYHMYQHPEAPSYEEQIAARDNLLDAYPQLKFTGAHIGSLEWNLDEVARRFDKYPNFTIDLSARMGHVQLHAIEDQDKVKSFFIQYQDRITYGSDTGLGNVTNVEQRCRQLYNTWRAHWLFLATDETIAADKFNIANAPEQITGLRLPKNVIDKIFSENAKRLFTNVN
jgi:predicted TIM-barrel fold metal-dependent hydrolase